MQQDLTYILRGGFVMYPLIFCAVVSLAVMIERFLTIRAIGAEDRALLAEVRDQVQTGQFEAALKFCAQSSAQIAPLIERGLRAKDLGKPHVERALQEAALEELPGMNERLGILDTIITIAPLLGLLGTVTGMIRAFQVTHLTGAANAPIAITGGVSEALIATAAGLTVAVITLPAYNALTNRVKERVSHLEWVATRVLNFIPAPAVVQATDPENLDAGSARSAFRSRRRKVRFPRPQMKRARIEIIPMIDTIFFLLVFFMIASLTLVRMKTMTAIVPKNATAPASGPSIPAMTSHPLILTVTDSGEYYLGKTRIAQDDLADAVNAHLPARPGGVVVLNVSKTRSMQSLIDVMDQVNQSRSASNQTVQILIATEPIDSEGRALNGDANVR